MLKCSGIIRLIAWNLLGLSVLKIALDLFSVRRTDKVETIVLLSHKLPDSHINVKVEFGEGEENIPLNSIAERAKQFIVILLCLLKLGFHLNSSYTL